jgi:hypothetical protein
MKLPLNPKLHTARIIAGLVFAILRSVVVGCTTGEILGSCWKYYNRPPVEYNSGYPPAIIYDDEVDVFC